ncbi:DUF2752 domain-containing protein [Thalassiella azotivora]
MTPVAGAATRTRASRLLPPLLTGATVGAATLAVAVRSPHVPGSWGWCPWLELTGTFCPGCGGLRAVHDAVHLDLVSALSSNAYVVVAGGVSVLAWALWLRAAAAGRRVDWGRWVTGRVAWVAVTALVVFSVVRNTGLAPWLAPPLV